MCTEHTSDFVCLLVFRKGEHDQDYNQHHAGYLA